jgi:hypothetical protein
MLKISPASVESYLVMSCATFPKTWILRERIRKSRCLWKEVEKIE